MLWEVRTVARGVDSFGLEAEPRRWHCEGTLERAATVGYLMSTFFMRVFDRFNQELKRARECDDFQVGSARDSVINIWDSVCKGCLPEEYGPLFFADVEELYDLEPESRFVWAPALAIVNEAR